MHGKISVSRFQSNKEPRHGIDITIIDDASGACMIRATLTPEQWGNAVSGVGYTDCMFELGAVDIVGMIREVSERKIKLEKSPYLYTDEEAKELLSHYETDGWVAHLDDFKNGHRYNYEKMEISVAFVRYAK